MAEAFLQVLLDKLSSLIQKEIGFFMGGDDEMKTLSEKLTTIQVVLEDAEDKQLESKPIRNWLSKLKDLAYEIEDVLDECATEVSKLEHQNSILNFRILKKLLNRLKIGSRMREVTDKLNALAAERDLFHLHTWDKERQSKAATTRETGSILNEPGLVYGRNEEKEKIVDILVNCVRDSQQLSVLPILGIGGIGKTTLAQLVYNDPRLTEHFEKKLWVCVSDNFDIKTLVEAMIESATKDGSASNRGLKTLDASQHHLWELLNQKKYLLILDDVWNEDQEKWAMLKSVLACGSRGASIVVTTRMKKLVLRSLFQDVSRDYKGETIFKMHDLVHDLAQSIMENKVPGAEEVESSDHRSALNRNKIRQVNVGDRYVAFPRSFEKEVDISYTLKNFNRLRMLDASWTEMEDLPSEIDKLKHLRYLKLSLCSHLRTLPDTVCRLWHLKILDLSSCNQLVELPKSMRYMKNLRHLLLEGREPWGMMPHKIGESTFFMVGGCESLSEMPPKIGELTSLKTLSLFVVGHEIDNQVGELQCLNLGGSLEIRHLERVKNHLDAKKANIGEKPNLRALVLSWRGDNVSIQQQEMDEKVLEALEPHPHLEKLYISGCKGRCFPPWKRIENIIRIHIEDCPNCLRLPPLGDLRHLKFLRLRNLVALEYVMENEVLQVGDQVKAILFPSLVELELGEMPNLKGLLLKQVGEEVGDIFPQLQKLIILDCPMLILPALSSLKELTARRCKRLINSLNKYVNLTDLTVDFDNDTRTCIPKETLENLSNLKTLALENANEHNLPIEGLQGLKSLKELWINNCNTLTCIPDGWLRHLTALEKIYIHWCKELVELPEGIKFLHSLKRIELKRLPKMVSLPEVLPSLQHLELWHLDQLTSLPDWLDNFITSSEVLEMKYETRFTLLPATSVQGMTNLRTLTIGRHVHPEFRRRLSYLKGNGEGQAQRAKFHLHEMGIERTSKIAARRETGSILKETHDIYGRDEEKEKIVDILVNHVKDYDDRICYWDRNCLKFNAFGCFTTPPMGVAKPEEAKRYLGMWLESASIVVTTRLKKVAGITGTLTAHRLTGLSEEHCWLLFKQRAFGQEREECPNLEAIGRQIVKKCAGVPLAAKALGGLLRFKREEKEWFYVKESEIWYLPLEDALILPSLRLSYQHLPLQLRQCFAHCAIFPKDSIIDKQELIFHWMAHGYISSNGILEVEDVGNEMHDLVPGAQTASSDWSASNSYKIRQVNLHKHFVAFPKSIQEEVNMSNTLINFHRLRILDASRTAMEDLPSAIGNLKHLRYLNLSYSKFLILLPNAISRLWNLQILDLNNCSNLVRLPKNMRYMNNLRHLFIEWCTSLSQMPPNIGKLTSLKTLSVFIVGHERGHQLDELQYLNLRGKLEIQHLERVKTMRMQRGQI
ncbi:hypothetical protein BUALT_Bualt05G0038700 [Buddleja alternifolia]|uniref:Disease resistance protein RGA3 n=1 Tax=Buddleja alternifolia TaxID=168488 RepID=A0AAV6XHV6_9LAMI|nr:hypothetical protein BUALT_Bualt05G0038700 [Buddleja alternifolia]